LGEKYNFLANNQSSVSRSGNKLITAKVDSKSLEKPRRLSGVQIKKDDLRKSQEEQQDQEAKNKVKMASSDLNWSRQPNRPKSSSNSAMAKARKS
jgi:hypothetical protein